MYPNPHDAFPLPPRPSLDQYKKLAKDLLKAIRSADPVAIRSWTAAWKAALSRLASAASNNNSVIPSEVAALQSEAATQSRDLLSRINHHTVPLEQFARKKLLETPTLTAAQFVIARAHGFESWPKFATHLEAIARENDPVNHFEQAADAIVTGDAAMLAALLKKHPDLPQSRSTRRHNATLLHYVAANGIEDYRQKTPPNIVDLATLLLDSGADVNAIADLYGGSATLSLTATSIHPERAGVQNELLQLLLDQGAALDEKSFTGGIVNSCLANGRARAAEFLASRGAPLDLEATAGVGRLDIVKTFFDESALPLSPAATLKRDRGFLWACEYGRNEVVDFLLSHGANIQNQANTGQTALHWAVIGGQKETIRLLLSRGAQLEAKNMYGGTALGQAQWSALHADSTIDYSAIIDLLKRQGATE
jgi:ankyrin repeat protein